eukprot:349282-Rhodomonas_salina.2
MQEAKEMGVQNGQMAVDSPGLVEVVDFEKREYALAALLDVDPYGHRYHVRSETRPPACFHLSLSLPESLQHTQRTLSCSCCGG